MFNNFIFTFIFILPFFILMTQGEMEKRQIGVLARSGVLPNGKRSVEALARNGELPGKREVQELNHWRLYKFLNDIDAALKLQALEHELGKRNMEAMARSGYLVKPATEPPEIRAGLLEAQDFLGKVDSDLLAENEEGLNAAESKRGGLESLARHGYIGKRDEEMEEMDDDKRSLGAAKNFLSLAEKRNIASLRSFISRSGKRNIGSLKNFMGGKRNLGSARNFASSKRDFYDDEDDSIEEKRNVGSARRFSGKRNIGAARNFLFNEMKRNLGAARQFFASGNKKNLGSARSFNFGKRNIASFARDGGFSNLKFPGRDETYPWEDEDEFDFDDFHEDEKRNLASFMGSKSGKRYLGSLRSGKRNIAAFKSFGKRLIDADGVPSSSQTDSIHEDVNEFLGKEVDDASPIEKRDIKEVDGGLHEQSVGLARRKRSPEFAFSPSDLSDLQDYSDYEDDFYANNYAKRFLGSEPRTSDGIQVDKRHIGALARLGLLPSFRSTRYSRSGRAIDNRIPNSRTDSSIRPCISKNSATSWPETSSIETKLAVRRSALMPFAPFTFWTATTPLERSIHWKSPVPYERNFHLTKHPMLFFRSG